MESVKRGSQGTAGLDGEENAHWKRFRTLLKLAKVRFMKVSACRECATIVST